MEDLIKALQILAKYGNPAYPCHCANEYLSINIPYDTVSTEDKVELEKLGFKKDSVHEGDGFGSYKYGSC